MENYTKLTIETSYPSNKKTKIIHEINTWELGVEETIESLLRLLVSVGYTETLVKNTVIDLGKMYESEQDEG